MSDEQRLQQRLARANSAKMCLDEFLNPMFDQLEAEWGDRMIEVANSELSREKRCDKITALSHALKITRTIRAGMIECVRDGELAANEIMRAEKVEGMTKPQRRLLGIAPGY